MKYRTILMFGAPGSGKGTHGRILGTIPGFFHCACGDVFRSLRADSPLGKTFLEYSSRGELVPDEPTVELWRQAIENSTRDGRFHPAADTLVLDGIPRNVHQAKMLSDTLDVVAVLYMTSARKENLIARMQRRALKDNRLDDANLDVIRRRFKTYEKETKPVLRFYGQKRVHRVNTDETPAATFLKVLEQIVRFG
ncbi:MAG: nucleoside monophosphate kinase [Verrucomicrobia bacterium]|nr:nucleoside monophosphate kinase [Verrucomicrobiota bacterium]MDE3099158.1 nucleoside monophosphate kinase [Verrucomicrobiota bacterium]